jgi:hypothetical protein
VVGLMKLLNSSKMYNLDGILVTGTHKIYDYNGNIIYVEKHPNAKLQDDCKEDIVYCVITNTKIIPIGKYTFLDWDDIDDNQFSILCNNCPLLPENATKKDIHRYMDAGIDENMTVPLYNINISKKISEIQVGDILMNGEKVIATVKIDTKQVNGIYEYSFDYGHNMISTNNVNIYKNRFGSVLNCKRLENKPEFMYHLITDKGLFTCNSIVLKDYNSHTETFL